MINIFIKLNNHNRGMSIIEVAVAIAFIMLAGTALMTMALTASAAVISARYKTMATKIAQEQIEAYRAKRNEIGWDQLILTPTVNPCPAVTPAVTPPIFTRTVCIIQPNTDTRQIDVSVTWNERGKPQQVIQSTKLNRWQ